MDNTRVDFRCWFTDIQPLIALVEGCIIVVVVLGGELAVPCTRNPL